MQYKVIVTTSIGLSKFEEVKPATSYRQALTIFAEEIQKDDIVSVLLFVNKTLIAEFNPTKILSSET